MWAGKWDIHWLDEVGSTNTYVRDRARQGAPAGLVAVADHQTAGRGRLDRHWESPPGANLLASVLLRPGSGAEGMHLCAGAVALAGADACREVAGVEPVLKWPNDLLLDGAKLAGVLAEAEFHGSSLSARHRGHRNQRRLARTARSGRHLPGRRPPLGPAGGPPGPPRPPPGRTGTPVCAARRRRRAAVSGRRGAPALRHAGPAGPGHPGGGGPARAGRLPSTRPVAWSSRRPRGPGPSALVTWCTCGLTRTGMVLGGLG